MDRPRTRLILVEMGPSAAVAAVRNAVRQALSTVDGPVLVACSGGPDSVALAAATAFLAPRLPRRAGLITVDHGLQSGSGEQAQRVAELGRQLGLDPVEVHAVRVGRAGGPESAARSARYAALDEAAARLEATVLLGHTLDDQAETVLLGLGRGSGARSIAGMPVVHGRYLRPLLGVRRATTVAACAAEELAVWDDPHNHDPSYQRARLRHEVLPLLEDVLHGGVAQALARTGDLVRDDLAALEAWSARVLQAADVDGSLSIEVLVAQPRAVRTRVVRTWAGARLAAPLSAERTDALDALIVAWRGQGPIELPGGVSVIRTSARLVLT